MTATAEHRPILNLPDSPLTLAAVETYRRGRIPVALVPGAKRPSRDGWERHPYRDERAVEWEFCAMLDGAGLGVRLGQGLADVDLDTEAARRAAPLLLPSTPMRSGRPSAPASHWWYRLADDAEHYVKHTGPDRSATVVEVRADAGHQTAIPPTVHPSGEPYRWEGEPWQAAEVSSAEVLAGAASVALVAILADAWPGEGSRHDAYLALVGGLLRGCEDMPEVAEAAGRIVSALATLTGDRDGARARVAEAVPTTVRRLSTGEHVTGWTTLSGLLRADVVAAAQRAADHLRDALGVRPGVEVVGDVAVPLYVDLSPLATSGRLPEPPTPDYLRRSDGAALLYRGRVNRLFGDPESGKTWVLLAAAGSVLAEGGRVAHVDVDHMGATLLVGRLGLLGVPLPVLGDPGRFRLYEPTDAEALRAVTADVAGWSPDLVGVDSLGEVLPMLGLSSNSPDDYTEAHRAVIQPFADSGACVVVIDHLAKSSDSRRQGPGGTLAKGRPVRGVSLRVRRVRDYAPGKGGASVLSVDKDTPGGVRAVCPPGSGGEPPAGVFRLAPSGEALGWVIDPPTPGDAALPEMVDTAAAERLSRALEEAAEPLSQSKARQGAKVREEAAGPLLDLLAAGGYVRRSTGARRARMAEHVKPYREGDPLPEVTP